MVKTTISAHTKSTVYDYASRNSIPIRTDMLHVCELQAELIAVL
jgi:hypothetical protein